MRHNVRKLLSNWCLTRGFSEFCNRQPHRVRTNSQRFIILGVKRLKLLKHCEWATCHKIGFRSKGGIEPDQYMCNILSLIGRDSLPERSLLVWAKKYPTTQLWTSVTTSEHTWLKVHVVRSVHENDPLLNYKSWIVLVFRFRFEVNSRIHDE